MKIYQKFLILMVFSILILISLSFVTYRLINSTIAYTNKTEKSEKLLMNLTSLRAQVRNQLLETYETAYVTGLKNHEIDIQTERNKVKAQLYDLKGQLSNEKWQELADAYARVDGGLSKVLFSKNINEKEGILSVREKEFNNGFIKKITIFIEQQRQLSKAQQDVVNTNTKSMMFLLIFFIVFGSFVAILFFYTLFTTFLNRLKELELSTQQLVSGNLNFTFKDSGNDEIALLSKALNHMVSSLLSANDKLVEQQELMIASSKMSALGEMAGGIAHEINTPLTSVILNAELLVQYNEDQLNSDPNIKKRVIKIIDTSKRIASIVKSLKSYSRDASNDASIEFTIKELLDSALNLCSEKLKNNNISLVIEVADPNIVIYGQFVPLSQVLINLLNNSIFAIKDLSEKRIKIEFFQDEKEGTLKVTDSGDGIPSTIIDKIFTPFFTTKGVGEGTGLGLSLSLKIVKLNGGELSYDKNSKNTCFILKLPLVLKNH